MTAYVFFFKQKTAYEMRISDWSSDVCSSDLCRIGNQRADEILTNISEGTGSLKDLTDLMNLSDNLYQLSNCGLGQTAGAPIRDILNHYRAEVEEIGRASGRERECENV